jgi:nitrite reductase/ring-hydroxylating ferredoxin subunit
MSKDDLEAVAPLDPELIPASDYLSPSFLQREYRHVWPHVWQVACREEELPGPGDYVTYDIGDQSLIVVRTRSNSIRAYHNVCAHRGRRLKDGFGTVAKFHCNYHGWQWDLEGHNIRVLDPDDWRGSAVVSAESLRLREALVDVWGGFVFVNTDRNAAPLGEYLAPVPAYLDCFEFEKMRYRWYVSVRAPCNWKVGLEAFSEGYHVSATHPQWPPFMDDVTRSAVYGKHGMFGYPTARPFGQPSPRLNRGELVDVRENLIAFYDDLNTTLAAIYSERATEAVRRLRTEVSAEASHFEILTKMYQFIREACEACGAGWPDINFEQMANAGTDWTIFPNLVILMQPDAALVYRVRPNGADVGTCIFDVWSLQRYAPGAEPKLNRRVYHGENDWHHIGDVSPVLVQDFSNMAAVQRGMMSEAFAGCRINPLQESMIRNHHQVLREYFSAEQRAAKP